MDFTQNFFARRITIYELPEYIRQAKKISGTIDKIIFFNQENNFLIARLNISASPVSPVIKGKIIQPCEGMPVELDGFWNNDKIYGAEFIFTDAQIIEPSTAEGIIRFLGSGLIKNIGRKTAEKIVRMFGVETLQIIEKFPGRLTEIPGIGKSKRDLIVAGYKSHIEVKKIMLFLSENNISVKFSYKLFGLYGNETISVLKKNPYVLIRDLKGIGFKKADEIAGKLGISKDHKLRMANGFFFLLVEAASAGHTFLPFDEFKNKSIELLEIDTPQFERGFADTQLLSENGITYDDDRVYLSWNFHSEKGIAENFGRLKNINILQNKLTLESIEKIIAELENEHSIHLSENQKNTVKAAITQKIFVLTGGPGTGKTTITYFIVNILKKSGMRVMLCSPTGRAAKRLAEITLEKTATIHRLLEYSPQSGFQKNEKNRLDIDALIIDEFSMVDLSLFYNLLKALRDETILLLIGDVNQLPSVSAGNLLNDIILSGKISVGRLTQIFRQDEKSLIVWNAHNIINKKTIEINNNRDSDFFVIKNEDRQSALAEILELFNKRLPKYGFGKESIQILAPVYKGTLGVDNLNFEIQKSIHTDKSKEEPFFQYGEHIYKVNDRIIQLKNNYNKNIMNGDIGKVISVGNNYNQLVDAADDKELVKKYLDKNCISEMSADIMLARFDDMIAGYTHSDADECSLAYAVTVHKSQGSEFDCVILPMVMDYYINLNCNLIYTAITRAKKMCVIIGELKSLFFGIKKVSADKRYSYLEKRLKNSL